MCDKMDTKVISIEEFLQVKIDEVREELSYNREQREYLRCRIEELAEHARRLESILEFLDAELSFSKGECNFVCICGSDGDYESCVCGGKYLFDRDYKNYQESCSEGSCGCDCQCDPENSYEHQDKECSGKCPGCKSHEAVDDSEILTVVDLANTVDIEDKSSEQVMDELVVFSDDEIEEAITFATWDYRQHHCELSSVSKFTIRAFIKYLESLLDEDGGVDISVGFANELLSDNKSVVKIAEGLWGRFQ